MSRGAVGMCANRAQFTRFAAIVHEKDIVTDISAQPMIVVGHILRANMHKSRYVGPFFGATTLAD